jgi:hypothetical protein
MHLQILKMKKKGFWKKISFWENLPIPNRSWRSCPDRPPHRIAIPSEKGPACSK